MSEYEYIATFFYIVTISPKSSVTLTNESIYHCLVKSYLFIFEPLHHRSFQFLAIG